MKKTVGELVYEKYGKGDNDPKIKKGGISLSKEVEESNKRLSDSIKEPLDIVRKAVESARSQMGFINNLNIPTIPDSFYDNELIIPEFNKVQEVRIINPEDISNHSAKKENDFVIVSYILPKDATWESLDIKFIDGHFVKVSHPKMKSKKFDYKDMGFINMKTTKPDLKWKLLKAIADNNGALTNERWDVGFGRNVKYELNEGLKKFFGMQLSPIPHYTKKRGYQPLFTIRKE